MAFGKAIERFSETVDEGHRHRLRPEGRHHAAARHRSSTSSSRRAADRSRSAAGSARTPTTPSGPWSERGLKVDVSHEYSDTVAEGLVISQDPTDGTLFRGDTVAPRVSLGPELVEVPNVVAYGVDDATATLRPPGSTSTSRRPPGYLGLGYVFSMDPGAGTELPKGSTVTLYLV